MGFRPDGSHQFGVVLPSDARTRSGAPDGAEVLEAVEATSWAQFVDDSGGVHLVLSDIAGRIVREYLPGEWADVVDAVPGDASEEPM